MPRIFDLAGSLREDYLAVDWAGTSLGPVEEWTEALRNAVATMLDTRFPVTLFWGPDFTLVYNEAYVQLIGDKHPTALGTPCAKVFPEVWDIIGPMMEKARDEGVATWVEDEYIPLFRRGFLEECYFTFSYSPVRNARREVEGVMDIATETTEQYLTRRRLAVLSQLTSRLADVQHPEDVVRMALPLLRADARDLAAVTMALPGLPAEQVPGLPLVPPPDLGTVTEHVVTTPAGRVVWLPLAPAGPSQDGYLVVLLSQHLAEDEPYLGFLRLLAASLRQSLDRVRVRTAERRTAEVQRTMSEAFQRSLLPARVHLDRPQIAMRYQPAVELAHVGGDWFDWFELPDGSLTLVIGDVAGHDQASAAAMAEVRNVARGVAYTMHPAAPRDVVAGLDRAMEGTHVDVIATAVLAQVVTAGDGIELTWSNAGHPAPVLVSPDGSTSLLDTTPDLLLGLDASTERSDHRVRLPAGATVVFYTDGLVERRDAPLTQGLAWLVEELRGTQDVPVEELCDHLLTTVAEVEDDIALLVLRA